MAFGVMRFFGQEIVDGARFVFYQLGQQALPLQQPRQGHTTHAHGVLREKMAATGRKLCVVSQGRSSGWH